MAEERATRRQLNVSPRGPMRSWGQETPQPLTPILVCEACDDVIGVFEPLVLSLDGTTYLTSVAATPELAFAHGYAYHRDCYPMR
jgi:hypothetical protein